MKTEEVIARLDWVRIGMELDQEGYASLPGLLGESQVRDLAALGDSAAMNEKVSLASQDVGRGELRYFSEALSPLIADLRRCFYRHLAPVANRWNEALGLSHRYPNTLDVFLNQNRRAGQTRSQSNLSRLREGDYEALHQRSEGEQIFPLQLVALLSAPGKDFIGGEFVMTEQRPRMQSRPMVLPLHRGDIAIISVAKRPHKGTKGYYRVNLKHAISRVRSGERVGLELMLHDAEKV
jgi:hypothetical protein